MGLVRVNTHLWQYTSWFIYLFLCKRSLRIMMLFYHTQWPCKAKKVFSSFLFVNIFYLIQLFCSKWTWSECAWWAGLSLFAYDTRAVFLRCPLRISVYSAFGIFQSRFTCSLTLYAEEVNLQSFVMIQFITIFHNYLRVNNLYVISMIMCT